MNGQRDIVSLSLPLTGGVILGLLLAAFRPLRNSPSGLYVLAALTAAGLFAMLWLVPARRVRRFFPVAALFVLLGLFCALSDSLAIRPVVEPWPQASAFLRTRVEAVPFPSEETGALVLALTTGDRSGLDQATVQMFRQSGASHLLALSGLHLGILYGLLLLLLRPLGNSRTGKWVRGVSLVVLAGAYTMATGASPSLVRAFLFILLNEAGRLLVRRPSPVQVLCGALTLQLALTPSVASSVGFQLSYLAMAGIVLLFPRLSAWYPSEGPVRDRWNLPRRLWELMALSISCQAFTGPLAWLRFGTFPKYFLLTNLLAMPLTNLLMMLAVACVGLSSLGCCPALLLSACDKTARLLLQVLGVIAGM